MSKAWMSLLIIALCIVLPSSIFFDSVILAMALGLLGLTLADLAKFARRWLDKDQSV